MDRSHSWLRKKGADIQNIYDKIQKRDVALERTLQSQHQDSYFYLELTQQTLPEYLQKAYEYSSMNLLQHAMTTHSVRSRLIDRAVS